MNFFAPGVEKRSKKICENCRLGLHDFCCITKSKLLKSKQLKAETASDEKCESGALSA